VTETIEKLGGRRPKTFDEFVAEEKQPSQAHRRRRSSADPQERVIKHSPPVGDAGHALLGRFPALGQRLQRARPPGSAGRPRPARRS
jgi:hypothetical protein